MELTAAKSKRRAPISLTRRYTPPPEQMDLFTLEEPKHRVPKRAGVAEIGIREGAKVLHDVTDYWDMFDYSLNPYVGCQFACSYCYAAFFVPDEQKQADWGKWVDVKVNGVREILRKRDLKGKRVIMSSATDPYQPLERKVQLTREIVEALAAPERQPIFRVQTRSPLAARDIDLFRRFEDIRVNMSVTTDSDAIRKRFEPSCASIEQRIEAIQEIKSAGIRVNIFVSPMLPIEDPERFARRLAAIGPDNVYSSTFNITDGHFKGSTRSLALQLASEYNWTELRVHEATEILKKHIPSTK